MKSTTHVLTLFAILSLGVSPALAQATNEGKPEAPPPSKAAPLETGGKPKTEKGAGSSSSGAMVKKSGGGMMKKKHRR